MTIADITAVSVNVGRARALQVGGHDSETGIFKEPVAGSVRLSSSGVDGDVIGDAAAHGGRDQAVYLYSAEDGAWWAGQLGREIPAGFFGENLTISRWWANTCIGDRLRCGSLVLELTAPRIPCATLAARVGDPGFVRVFAAARRPGAYARVLAPGAIAAGDRMTVVPATTAHPTLDTVFTLWHSNPRDADLMRRCLEAPIAERARARLTRWLAEAESA